MLEVAKRDRRAERRSATRAEIVEAAWEVCRENGLASMSLREVGRRVGLQAPSLYSYFGSKSDLYDAMFAQGCTEFLEARPALPDDDLAAGVRVTLRYYLDFCSADPVRHQLLFQRTIPGFAPSPESFALAVRALDLVTEWLAAMGLGAPEVVDLYTALASGLADQQNANDPGGDRWARLVDQASDMFVTYARSLRDPQTTHRRDQP